MEGIKGRRPPPFSGRKLNLGSFRKLTPIISKSFAALPFQNWLQNGKLHDLAFVGIQAESLTLEFCAQAAKSWIKIE